MPGIEDVICPRCHAEGLGFPSRNGVCRPCPDCGLDFEVQDGEALYDPDKAKEGQDVECSVTGVVVEVSYRSGNYTCPECQGEIEVEDGKAVHEDGPDVERVSDGDGRSVYVLVHGFANDGNADFSQWEGQLRAMAWTGDVVGFQWPASAGVIIDGLHRVVGPVIAAPNPALLASVGAAALLTELAFSWRKALQRAETHGPQLANVLRRLAREYDDVRLLGFSLGARVVHFALKDLARAPASRRVRVRLCAGAVPVDVSWRSLDKVVHRTIDNYHSDADWVLEGAFRAGNFSTTAAIGTEGLSRATQGRVRNYDAHVGGDPVGHLEYETNFAHFGRL